MSRRGAVILLGALAAAVAAASGVATLAGRATDPASEPLATAASSATAAPAVAAPQRRFLGGDPPEVEYENVPYNGAFTFARIRFEPSTWGMTRQHAWGLDLKWNHDYPRADRRLAQILQSVSGVEATLEGSTIVRLTDPELFLYPWAYLCEPGFLTLTEQEVETLRAYLLKGGFIVVDDFDGYAWYNLEEQMQRVIPDGRWVEIDESHHVFHTFFEIDDLRFGGGSGFGALGYGYPRYLALFEDNDPSKRLMMIAHYNNDIGEYWEHSESPYILIDLSNDAYKLGVNYVIYSMLH